MQNKKTLKNTIWYFGGTVITAILGLISSPLLTRVLSTEVYAQYGMIISFTAMLSTFIFIGHDEAFMRFFENRKDGYFLYLWKCIRWPFLLCVITLIILLEPTHTVSTYIFAEDIGSFSVAILGFYIIFLVIQRFLMLTARMEENAANYSISNIITKAFFLVAVFGFYYINKKVSLPDTIFSLMLGVMCAMLLNMVVVVKSNHSYNPNGIEVSAKELFFFGIPFAFSSTMYLIVPVVEKLIIRKKTDWTTLAIYTAAAIFITVMSLIKQTVNSIWVPYVYKEYENKKTFKETFNTIGMALSWFSVCILSFVIVTRRWLVLVFDTEYYDTRLIAPALMCGACFDLLSSIYSIGINIKKQTKYHILVPIVQILVSVSFLTILLPILGVRATGISYMFSIALSRGIQIIIGLKLYGTGKKYTGLLTMIILYLLVGILSCLFETMIFDVGCAVSMFCVATFVARNELKAVVKMIIK